MVISKRWKMATQDSVEHSKPQSRCIESSILGKAAAKVLTAVALVLAWQLVEHVERPSDWTIHHN
jgi:hypothetical protein